MLDQQITAARPVAEQRFDLRRGIWINLAALGCGLRPPAPLAGVLERANLMDVMAHGNVRSPCCFDSL
jgi:hypothetical protein